MAGLAPRLRNEHELMGDVVTLPGVEFPSSQCSSTEDVAIALQHAAKAIPSLANIVIIGRHLNGNPELWASSNNMDEIAGLLMQGVQVATSMDVPSKRLEPDDQA